jgi:hypothetical protein
MAKNAKDEPRDKDTRVTYWLNEIAEAKKREQSFRKDGEKILAIYDGTDKSIPFNILFSNTETLMPAVYSTIPRPVVERRFKDDDPLGKNVSLASTRMLEFLLDTNLGEYDTFDTVMRHDVSNALLPGRGISCVTYDAQIYGMDEADTQTETPEAEQAESPVPTVQEEIICLDTKGWNRVYFGYAKKWSKVPWIAFEEYVD